MKFTKKDIVKYTLLLALTAALLWLALRKISWNDFVGILKQCNWWWIVLSMAIQWLITWLRGNRWRIMMRPLSREITRRETYDAYAVCYLANIPFPRLGEVVRCGLMGSTGKATFEASLGTVVIERTWDILCTFILCIPLLFFGRFRDFLLEKMFKPAAESMHMSTLWLVIAVIAAIALLIVLLVRLRERISRHKGGAKVMAFFHSLADGIKSGFKMERKWAFFGYTALIWTGYLLTSLFVIYAFPGTEGMGAWDALFIMVVGTLGWIVPVQGGFGAYHFIVAITLVPMYGFDFNTGMAFATISHESQIVQMLVCGLISLASWYICKNKIKKTEK